jgi:ferredoxin
MVRRGVVKVNEDLCNGCGKCVAPCVEGAITIVNGKARVQRELCDGLGYCVATCPTGALSIEEREMAAFNETPTIEQHLVTKKMVASCFKCKASESERALFPVRIKGRAEWVCARCIPQLIHG